MNTKPFFFQLHARAEKQLGTQVSCGDTLVIDGKPYTFVAFYPAAIASIIMLAKDQRGNEQGIYVDALVKRPFTVIPTSGVTNFV